MQSEHLNCVSLSIYLSLHLSICVSLSRYICVYIFIHHSIYLSLYMIIIKQYCFQIEQLKLWKKQNILYFENDVIFKVHARRQNMIFKITKAIFQIKNYQFLLLFLYLACDYSYLLQGIIVFIMIDQINEMHEDGLKSPPETSRFTENKWISRKSK